MAVPVSYQGLLGIAGAHPGTREHIVKVGIMCKTLQYVILSPANQMHANFRMCIHIHSYIYNVFCCFFFIKQHIIKTQITCILHGEEQVLMSHDL